MENKEYSGFYEMVIEALNEFGELSQSKKFIIEREEKDAALYLNGFIDAMTVTGNTFFDFDDKEFRDNVELCHLFMEAFMQYDVLMCCISDCRDSIRNKDEK